MKGDNVRYFDDFGVKHIPKEIKTLHATTISQQFFIEYKQMIQCVDIFYWIH